MEDGTKAQKQGVNWGTSRSPPEAGPWVGGATRERISGWKRARGSDEAIVSDDLAGHYNPPGSQGPLDGIVLCCWRSCRLSRMHTAHYGQPLRGPRDLGAWTLAAYKASLPEACGPRLTPVWSLKMAAEFPFEAVLGKPRRTEF